MGDYTNGDGRLVPLAERWSGGSWSVQSAPSPSGGGYGALYGVSCPSSTSCIAVGDFYDKSAGMQLPLAERWNGVSWSIQATPAGATSGVLTGVSCVSSTACTAVGDYTNGVGTQLTLAERWDGVTWSIETTPNPGGATNSVLNDVSCTSSTACTAVGDYGNAAGTQMTLGERWNGVSWSIQNTPNPAGSGYSVLLGVSCSSSTACTAVGYFDTSDAQPTLAESWNGARWSIQTTANPSVAPNYDFLSGVSCSARTACTAVGSFANSTDTLAERWNGVSWSIQSTPNPAGARYSVLSGVSCPSSTACTAVGYFVVGTSMDATLVERWNGASWSIQPTPVPAGGASGVLNGVSCPSSTACTAAGSYTRDGRNLPLAESWNGVSWSIQVTPAPADGANGVLRGVSCSSSTACTAVGDYTNSAGAQLTLAERWNGVSWSIQSIPIPPGSTYDVLNGVSCASSTACTAVGYFYSSPTSNQAVPLAESWNGASWSIQATPATTGAATYGAFNAVSCTSSTACTAVGWYVDSAGAQVTLTERGNGARWSIQSTPKAPDTTNASLNGVSCTSSTACTAVGSDNNAAGTQQTLAEGWNGASWSIQSTANEAGITPDGLNGTSCTSSTSCTAVGSYLRAVSVAMAERNS